MVSRAQFSKVRESPKGMRILKFLRRQPMPAKITGVDSEDETISCVIPKKPNNAAWTDTVRVLIDCTDIKAYDDAGNIMRVLPIDPDDPTLQAEEETVKARTRGYQGQAPIISVDVPKLVDNIAKNLKDVAVAAASMQAQAFTAGFEAMTNVMNTTLNMIVRLEERLGAAEDEADAAKHEVIETRAQLQAAASSVPDEAGTNREQLAMMALERVMGGGGGTNGQSIPPNQMAALQFVMQHLQAQAQQQQPPEGAPSNGA